MKQPPSKLHQFAVGHDIAGNTFVAIKTGRHIDYIYGMFKGRELLGGHLEAIESWHKEGDKVPFLGHPTKGEVVLVMGLPIVEITGPEAKAIINQTLDESYMDSDEPDADMRSIDPLERCGDS